MPLPKGSGVMPIPILSQESPNIAIVNWYPRGVDLLCPHDLDDVYPDRHLLCSY